MAGMGPPPKNPGDRRRRNATVPMVQLPAGGRKGPTPKWPLEEQSPREKHWWVELWKLPQAAAWEKFNLHLSVARYVQVLTLFDMGSMKPHVWTECRQFEDRLGLNPMAMMRLRWTVSDDELADVRAARPARERPEAIDPTAAAG